MWDCSRNSLEHNEGCSYTRLSQCARVPDRPEGLCPWLMCSCKTQCTAWLACATRLSHSHTLCRAWQESELGHHLSASSSLVPGGSEGRCRQLQWPGRAPPPAWSAFCARCRTLAAQAWPCRLQLQPCLLGMARHPWVWPHSGLHTTAASHCQVTLHHTGQKMLSQKTLLSQTLQSCHRHF